MRPPIHTDHADSAAGAGPHGATRRDLFKYAAGGAVVLGLGGAATLGRADRSSAVGATRHIALWATEGFRTMIDGTQVYAWAFSDAPGGFGIGRGRVPAEDPFPDHVSFFPDATLHAVEGEEIHIEVTNRLDEDHSFVIEDRVAHRDIVNSGRIAPGETWTGTFSAPPAGMYIFQDTLQRPLNRVLGLHGMFVVMAAQPVVTSLGTPMTAYGTGDPVLFERQWVWELHGVDPVWAQLASAGFSRVADFPPYVARYFTINNRSGVLAFSSDGAKEDTTPHGHLREADAPGQLIRLANVGLNIHGAHFHGNHVRIVAAGARVLNTRGEDTRILGDASFIDHAFERDMVLMEPLDHKDVVLPFEQPRDIATPERSLVRGTTFAYPMHSHAEMSQTAAGGLYPNGMLTDWELEI
jgi:hypothetical protein